ncbi:MAG: sulfotransferase, partial [Gordonia sp.]
ACSLAEHATRGWSDTFTGATLGRSQLELWSRGLRVFTESRARHNPEQFLDVDFADLRRDPMGTVERVYAALGIPMSEAARSGVRTLDEESKTGARAPSHTYSLADYGLDADDVARAFAT